MSLITDLVDELRSDLGVQTPGDTLAWKMILAAPPGFTTEVTIAPEGVFEWYVTVFDAAGDEVWSDWMEHYAKNPDPAELMAEMVSEIRAFVNTMAEAEHFRVSTRPVLGIFGFTFGRLTVAEWLRGGEWHPVGPFCFDPNETPSASANENNPPRRPRPISPGIVQCTECETKVSVASARRHSQPVCPDCGQKFDMLPNEDNPPRIPTFVRPEIAECPGCNEHVRVKEVDSVIQQSCPDCGQKFDLR